jgi:hypothetical protein
MYHTALLQGAKYSEEALEKERDALAKALERLAVVQRELAMGQHELMAGQKALAEQQDKLVQFLESPFDEAAAALNVEMPRNASDYQGAAGPSGLGENTPGSQNGGGIGGVGGGNEGRWARPSGGGATLGAADVVRASVQQAGEHATRSPGRGTRVVNWDEMNSKGDGAEGRRQ